MRQKIGYGLVQAYDAYELLSLGGCSAAASYNDPCLPEGKVSFEVEIITDNYGSETTWELKGPSTETGGPYADKIENIYVQLCILPGNYQFIMKDSAEDGMCCGYGNGSYDVKSSNVKVMKGDIFGASEATDFVAELSTPATPEPTPNPTPAPTSNPTSAPSPNSTPSSTPFSTPIPTTSVSPVDGDTCVDTPDFKIGYQGTKYTCENPLCNRCFVRQYERKCFNDNCCICGKE